MSATATAGKTPGQILDDMLDSVAAGNSLNIEAVKQNSPTMEKVKTAGCVIGCLALGIGVSWLLAKAAEAIIAE